MKKSKQLYTKYRHLFVCIIYFIFYMTVFCYAEQKVTRNYQVIHMGIDDYIPFCEVFIIPYILWFGYVALSVLYFGFTSKDDYYRTCLFLFTGMTVFLVVSLLFPNGHHLRPTEFPRDNVFTHMVAALYRTDTPTNLWPSIHVYNSLGVHFAIMHSRQFEHKRSVRIGSFLLCSLIILSTVFLKQHSMFDVLTAFVMAAIMYAVVYRYDLIGQFQSGDKRHKVKTQVG